jgi:hypothetical protein
METVALRDRRRPRSPSLVVPRALGGLSSALGVMQADEHLQALEVDRVAAHSRERRSVCWRLLSHLLGSQPVDTFGLAGDAESSESGSLQLM